MEMKIYNTDGDFLFQENLAIMQIGSAFYHKGILYQIKGIISTDLSVDIFVPITDRTAYLSEF